MFFMKVGVFFLYQLQRGYFMGFSLIKLISVVAKPHFEIVLFSVKSTFKIAAELVTTL